MKVSKIAASNARRIFRLCQTHGRFDETKLLQAVRRLAEVKPRGYRGILVALKRLVRLELERRHAVIESAATLDEPTKLRIAANLGAKYGPDLSFEYRAVPALVAGLRIRVGSDVWDGTVKARLDRFVRAF